MPTQEFLCKEVKEKRRNIFDDVDFDTAEKIAEEFPALSKKDMDRMFRESMEKAEEFPVNEESRDRIFNSALEKSKPVNLIDGFENAEVMKVEKYKKPRISRYIGFAASAAIAVAGIGGMGILLSNNSGNPVAPVGAEPATENPTELKENMTVYEKAAYRITDEYLTLGRYIYAGGFEYKDANGLPPKDSGIELNYSYTHSDSGIEETGSQVYYPVIDEKFPDMEALKEYYYSYRTEGYTVYAEDMALEDVLFGGDVTAEDMESPETLGDKLYNEDGVFYEYINIEGQLCMLQYPIVDGIESISAMKWIDEPVISDITENSFTASRKFVSVEGNEMAYVTIDFEIMWDETVQDWRGASETITGEPIEQE